MSDEASRPVQGNRPPQRRDIRAPDWWSRLTRTDLPDERLGSGAATGPAAEVPAVPDARDDRSGPRTRSRRSGWLINLVVVAAGLVLVLIGVGATSTHSALAALLVIAVPLALAGLAGTAVMRHLER